MRPQFGDGAKPLAGNQITVKPDFRFDAILPGAESAGFS